MKTPRTTRDGAMSDLYDQDLLLWSEQQADLLRRRAAGEITNDADLDWLNIAEEIEAVGASQRRELRSRLIRLLQHLLKWRYQPELPCRSWRATIKAQRADIDDLLAQSPSLRRALSDLLTVAYHRARDEALEETGLLNLPELSPFTMEDVLGGELRDEYCEGVQPRHGLP